MKKRTLLLIPIIVIILLIRSCFASPDSSNTSESEPVATEYIDVVKTNEQKNVTASSENVPVTFNNSSYKEFVEALHNEDYSFQYSDYYGLEEALQLYETNGLHKSTSSDLLDSNGYIDSDKLLTSVNRNNATEMEGETNAVNAFYTETSESDKAMICDLIAEAINSTCNETERKYMANTLSALKIFNRTGSASNAYVTHHLTFVYNPSMSEMYAEVQQMQGDDDKEAVTKSVLVHEIMHLLRHQMDALDDTNGIKVAMCRTYNLDT